MAKWKVTLKIEVPDAYWSREISQEFEAGSFMRHGLMEGFEKTLNDISDDIERDKKNKQE